MRDIRSLIIFILCVMTISIGGYITYDVLDNGKINTEAKLYQKSIYLDSYGELSLNETEKVILSLNTSSNDVRILDYLLDNYNNNIIYILFRDSNKVYYYHDNNITFLTDYITGSYKLSYDKNLIFIGYLFHNDDYQYYYDLNKKVKILDSYKYPELGLTNRNSFNNLLIAFPDYHANKCNNGYIRKIDDEDKLITGTSFNFYLYDNKIYLIENINCESINYRLYNIDTKLLIDNISYLDYSLEPKGIIYVRKDNDLLKYNYDGIIENKITYKKLLELHDGYALIKNNKINYLLRLSDLNVHALKGNVTKMEEQYYFVNNNTLIMNIDGEEKNIDISTLIFEEYKNE